MKKKLIRIIVVFLAFLVALPVIHIAIWQFSQMAAPITDPKKYGTKGTSGWVSDDPYAVFPEEDVLARANGCEYLYKREYSPFPIMFDDDIVTYLKCEFEPQAYQQEKHRCYPTKMFHKLDHSFC